jgi:transcriptional regulator with XRE-family HTH domain
MSQESLGERLGVSFQQVQKYERGSNRVSASRLFFLADALDVPVSYFFEGLDESGRVSGEAASDDLYAFITSPDGVILAAAFSSIGDQSVRRKLIELARAVGGGDDAVADSA